MLQADITAIPFTDETFDAVICNHVLEHIPDDRRALAELQRVLKRNGWASIQVPIEGKLTREDPSIRGAEGRTFHYGQADHVRQYGRDFLLRLSDGGFSTWTISKEKLLPPALLNRVSVECEKEVWICFRQR